MLNLSVIIIVCIFVFFSHAKCLLADEMDDFIRATYKDKIVDDNPYDSSTHFDLAVDFKEEQDRFVAEFNIDGIDQDSIKIDVGLQVLAVTGRLKIGYETFYNNEKIYKDTFVKNIPIPLVADRNRITSSIKDGRYIIVMPKLNDWYYKKKQ